VYCLSKKDTEVVAQGLMEASNGAIKVNLMTLLSTRTPGKLTLI
jgi:hypothetical protein